MKKLLLVIIMGAIMLSGCGKEENEITRVIINDGETIKEHVLEENIETEKTMSEEYLNELEYNSQTNSYFGN